jgi:hypothetical protein
LIEKSTQLLTCATQVSWFLCGAEVAAPRIDIQPATAGVARIHGQLLRLALAQDVDEDAFDALLVEFVVFAEADQVASRLSWSICGPL